ncbi:ABC transporter permease [Sharpea azabuensis]|uniref:ABC transporter permease n=1 Tax=Sharpea porci TaxID=2652286 RepID=A0A844FS78_9FIRM|nr:ABC transporter permease [Sharpea porci]MDD6711752.1 ABC transporter permease [Sharpea porci]MDY5279092.1 ABC transporter permease [Sharpea porci]MST88495.1 ABC transporter permease [Sharpea porci]
MEKENVVYKKRQILSSQVDLSKFNKKEFEKATDEEKKQQDVMGESTTFFKDGMRRLRKNPLAMGSIIILVALILIILITPHIVPYSYSEMITVNGVRDKGTANLAPFQFSPREQAYMTQTGKNLFPHIFGTDSLGRDYFIRCVYGTRVSLSVGIVAAIMVLIIGLIYGSISGYFGGRVDMIMMRIVDIIYSLPDMLLIILLSVVFKQVLSGYIKGTVFESLGSNMLAMFIVFGLLYWVTMARLVRGQILQIKNNEYVLAAKAIGTPNRRILLRHIIPNCLSVIIITTALQVPSAIFTESYLSFLGLGVSAPMPSLGSLANDARQAMQSYPSRLIIPAVIIVLIVLALNLLGDGLRDAFDSKLN